MHNVRSTLHITYFILVPNSDYFMQYNSTQWLRLTSPEIEKNYKKEKEKYSLGAKDENTKHKDTKDKDTKHNVLCWDVPLQDVTEDSHHGFIIKLVDGDGVEMAQETWGNRVATATCTSSSHFHIVITLSSSLQRAPPRNPKPAQPWDCVFMIQAGQRHSKQENCWARHDKGQWS